MEYIPSSLMLQKVCCSALKDSKCYVQTFWNTNSGGKSYIKISIMKNLWKIIYFYLIISINAEAQPVIWTRYYDYNNWSNYGRQVIQTFDGGYAIYSETSVSDNSLKKNILLTKTDLNGNVEFNRMITDSTIYGLLPTAFQQTNDSGFILSGIAAQTGFLIKTDKNGNLQWRRDFTRPGASVRFWNMKITQDQGFICGGDISISTLSLRQYILKTDSIGNIQWDSIYLGFAVDDIVQSQGFYYVVNGNIFRKLNATGGIIWERDSSVSCRKILEHPNRFFYLLNGDEISKFDSSGNVYWKKNYYTSFPASVGFQDICLSENTDLILAGFVSDPYTIYPDCFLARVDTDGIVKNYRIIQTGKADYDYLESIIPTSDNGFISVGGTSFTATRLYWNTIAVKTDSAFNTAQIVGISNEHFTSLDGFTLYQNYPNPFNPSTTIKFYLNKTSKVKLKIYDAAGKLVADLINNILTAGYHEISFTGEKISSGIYYYYLSSENLSIVKKMVYLK